MEEKGPHPTEQNQARGSLQKHENEHGNGNGDEAEEQWRLLYQTLPGGCFIVDETYVIQDANDFLCTLTGFERADLVGQTCDIICPQHPHQCPIIEQDQERIDNVETWIKTQNRHRVPIIKSARRLFLGDKEVIVESFQDITEQKQAEEALRQSEEFNRTLIENSPIGISVRSPTGQLLFHNPAWQKIWDIPDERIAADMTHPRPELVFDKRDDYLAHYQQELKRVYETGGSLHISELRVKHPRPGKAEWISQHFYAIQDAQGQVDRVVILTQDISERKWSEEILHQRNNELTTLYEAATAISSALSLDVVLQTVAEQITQVTNADRCTLSLWNREHDLVETLVDHGRHLTNNGDIPGTTYNLNRYPATRYVLETGQPMIIQRDDPLADSAEQSRMERHGIQTLLMLPLITRDRVMGLAELIDTITPRDYTPEQIRLAQSLTTHAAIAIENAQLYERAQQEVSERKLTENILLQRNRELALLNQAGRTFNSTLDLDQVLAIVLEEVRSLLDVTALSLWLTDAETDTVVCRQASGPRSEVVQDWSLARGEGIVGWAVQHGESVIVPDTREDSRHFSNIDQRTGVELRSILSIPLIVRENVIGALQVVDTTPNRFELTDLALMEPLAASASVAIENARLHQALLDHADHLEQRVNERTAELEAQYARLDAILHNTADGILVTDIQGEIIQANPVAQTWLTQTLSPEDEEQLRKAVYDLALQANERPTTVLELKGLDLELRTAPISVPGMENLAAVVDIHDVSHLRALNRMKTRFISNISHELRTPITTIKLCAHLMKRQPEHWQGHLNTLIQEAEHQAQLVESILKISRLDAGRLEMDPCPTSLDELAESIVASRQILAQEKHLNLAYHANPTSPVLALVDRGWMTQVLDNLVGNAIRYTPTGGAIDVSTATQEAEGRTWATVTISDTGMGIPAEELPHIFDRFFRGEKPRTMQLTGTGLGLSIVQEIVELHGGWVIVESEEDVGSTFTIWLPIVTPGDNAPSS